MRPGESEIVAAFVLNGKAITQHAVGNATALRRSCNKILIHSRARLDDFAAIML